MDQELSQVMDEITGAMGGHGAALTLHPDDGRPARVHHVEGGGWINADLVQRLIRADGIWPRPEAADVHRWCSLDMDGRAAIAMPVQRIAGHSRAVITVFFDDMTAEKRAFAESVYVGRRPFAIGYFRLWQEGRVNAKKTLAFESTLDLAAQGVILVSLAREIIFANASARAILEAGNALKERGRRIQAVSLGDSANLQAAIDHVLIASERPSRKKRAPLLNIHREDTAPLIVAVLPVNHLVEEQADVAAILFIVDPASNTQELLEPVCRLFRLSHVETKLACLLAAGATLAETAAGLRVKDQTARSYLKQIFLKTGTNRQAELVRVMLSSLVRTSRDISFDVI